ncbi:MAG: TolC family protein [Myxococcota bacterium]
MIPRRLLPMLLVGLPTLGCASTRPTEARARVGELVAQRSGLDDVIEAERDANAQARTDAQVDRWLTDPLTEDRALRIALLNNRGLRATFEDLGIAQADLVEAGLLDNPVVGGDLVVSSAGNGLGGGLGLSQSLLSAFLLPAQRRLARARLQAAIVRVADASLALVRDVKVAYAHVQWAWAGRTLHRTVVQAGEVADDLARRQHEAGNLTDLEREQIASALDEARLELADRELEVTMARETLNRLLGLWGSQTGWTLAESRPKPVPVPGPGEADLSALEQAGIAQRLDVSAARYEVEAIERALEMRRRGLIPQVEAGVEARNEVGNDEGHEWVVGPSLSVELPLFNPGHADFARLRAQLRQAQHRLSQTAIDARSHIRSHREQLLTARRRASYMHDVVLPRQQVLGQRALERYNAMLIGAYELLDVRAAQVQARLHYVEALRDYWVARADLERAVGGMLPS